MLRIKSDFPFIQDAFKLDRDEVESLVFDAMSDASNGVKTGRHDSIAQISENILSSISALLPESSTSKSHKFSDSANVRAGYTNIKDISS